MGPRNYAMPNLEKLRILCVFIIETIAKTVEEFSALSPVTKKLQGLMLKSPVYLIFPKFQSSFFISLLHSREKMRSGSKSTWDLKGSHFIFGSPGRI